MDEVDHTTVGVKDTTMRATYAWLQRYGRRLVDKVPGSVSRRQVPVLLASVLVSLGLLALWVSWSSQGPGKAPHPAIKHSPRGRGEWTKETTPRWA